MSRRDRGRPLGDGGPEQLINIRLTKDIGPNLHRLWGVGLVGATLRIVYGRAGATYTPSSVQAPGSVPSRTYILMREPSLPPQTCCLSPY